MIDLNRAASAEILSQESQSDGLVLAWFVLIGLLSALVVAGIVVWRLYQGPSTPRQISQFQWIIPLLAVSGLGIAGYLTFVEIGRVTAVCGPVGDCNAVQNSPFARLFGLPLGVIGLAGYGLILGAWFWGRTPTHRLAGQMPLVVFCAALFSVLFSIYLTCLEIFVIQAVCIWCLSSAIVVAAILVVSTGPLAQTSE